MFRKHLQVCHKVKVSLVTITLVVISVISGSVTSLAHAQSTFVIPVDITEPFEELSDLTLAIDYFDPSTGLAVIPSRVICTVNAEVNGKKLWGPMTFTGLVSPTQVLELPGASVGKIVRPDLAKKYKLEYHTLTCNMLLSNGKQGNLKSTFPIRSLEFAPVVGP